MSALTAILLSWFIGVTGTSADALCGPDGKLDTQGCPAGAPPPEATTGDPSSSSPGVGTKPGDGGKKTGNRIYNGI